MLGPTCGGGGLPAEGKWGTPCNAADPNEGGGTEGLGTTAGGGGPGRVIGDAPEMKLKVELKRKAGLLSKRGTSPRANRIGH
ncbi:hypothetical protein LOK49_LG14G01652 [Camellia lanceoleosa]|uniref:Uncharacterized protein n=1 Tax=Camellia lanceoleosa TaxID=1840588 RepID=A0ACC0FD71_9ERIC|nr:hypothetical protein LOK49_LG14G01652 [Camellia lanceoleosa]